MEGAVAEAAVAAASSYYNFSDASHQQLLHRIAEEYQNQTHWFSTRTVVALVVSYGLVISLGLLGNIFVVIIMFRRKDLRTSRNLYILNLALCDVLMCAVCMPLSLVKYVLKRWPLGAGMCRVVPALATIDVFVSTFTILAIAGDRYRSIVHASVHHSSDRPNHRPPGQQPKTLIYKMVSIWAASVVLAVPFFLFHHLRTESVLGKPVFHTCIEVWPHDRVREICSLLVALVQYLTPTIVISYLHARICCFLRRRIHDSPTSEAQIRRSQRQMKRHRKNLVLLSSIAVSFSLAWLPLTILNITADWTHDSSVFGMFGDEKFYLVHAVCLLIAMTSSAVNPLLYGWFNGNFRNAFLQILRCSKEVSKKAPGETSLLKANLSGGKGGGTDGTKEGSGAKSEKGEGSLMFRVHYDSLLRTPSPASRSREGSMAGDQLSSPSPQSPCPSSTVSD